jgi:hypothetical protein
VAIVGVIGPRLLIAPLDEARNRQVRRIIAMIEIRHFRDTDWADFAEHV